MLRIPKTEPWTTLYFQEAPPLKDAKPDPHYGEKPASLSCAAVAKQYQRRGRDAANAKLAAKKVRKHINQKTPSAGS
jgi:hypothetical protein